MRCRLLLADGRTCYLECPGPMSEIYDKYNGADHILDGQASTILQIQYDPAPVDFRAQDVTACFLGDFSVRTVPCTSFHLHLAPYYQGQMGHELICVLPGGKTIQKSSLYRPDVLLISGIVQIPECVLYETLPNSTTIRQSRLRLHDPQNLRLIADWCRQTGNTYQWIDGDG